MCLEGLWWIKALPLPEEMPEHLDNVSRSMVAVLRYPEDHNISDDEIDADHFVVYAPFCRIRGRGVLSYGQDSGQIYNPPTLFLSVLNLVLKVLKNASALLDS